MTPRHAQCVRILCLTATPMRSFMRCSPHQSCHSSCACWCKREQQIWHLMGQIGCDFLIPYVSLLSADRSVSCAQYCRVTIRTGHLAKPKSLSNSTSMPGKLLKRAKTFTCKQPPHKQNSCTESSKLRRISLRHRLSRTSWTRMEMLHLETCLQWNCCLARLSIKLNMIGLVASSRVR